MCLEGRSGEVLQAFVNSHYSNSQLGAVLRVRIEFSEDFPGRPPKCVMEFLDKEAKETVFHPNIYPSGTVCLSILNEDKDWRPILTVVTILQGINDMMDNPNPNSPAQEEAFRVYEQDKDHLEWQKRVFDQATRIIEGKAYKHLAQVDGATSVRGAAAADGGSAASDKTGSTASSNGIR